MPRISIPLNHCWKYIERFNDKYLLPDCDESAFMEVTIPHTNVEVPYNYFDETISQIVSCYRNAFDLDQAYRGKQIFLDFEGVMAYAEVYLNGELLGSHKGGYTPFSLDLTGKIDFEKPNTLAVKVDSRERDDIPPFGGSIDYLTFGGIYREVNIRIVDPLYIENVFIRPQDVLEDEKSLEYSLFLSNASSELQKLRVDATVKDGENRVAHSTETVSIEARSRKEFMFEMRGL
ncbi:MAG: glycoside hydrolase family 2 protein, partial [bacterium]|nr:glycoside hydrolase family 2 protein [bacterium]